MQHISVEYILDHLDNKLLRAYYEVVSSDSKNETLETLISKLLSEIENLDENSLEDDLAELSYNNIRNINRTKARWLQAFISQFEKELANIENEMIRASMLKSYNEELALLQSWVNDSSMHICDFKYFSQKRPSQRVKAFRLDVQREILHLAQNELKKLKQEKQNEMKVSSTLEMPIEMTESPMFSIKKSQLKLKSCSEDPSIIYDEYQVSKDYFLRTYLVTKENENNNVDLSLKRYYTLDEKDSEIIGYLYTRIQPEFHNTRRITVDIRDMVEKFYNSVNSYAYKDIESRLLKLADYRIEGVIKKEGQVREGKFKLTIFPSIVIETDSKTNKRIATIEFSDFLYDAYLKQRTIKVDSEHYYSLDNSLSKILFFPLQKERLSLWGKGTLDQPIILTYEFFKQRVRLKTPRNRKKNMALIVEALQCFVDHNILIESFSVNNSEFLIKFLPLSENDLKALDIPILI